MYKTRSLGLYDILRFKKDFLWGKYYYGAFEKGSLINSILFSKYLESDSLIEIHSVQQPMPEFLLDFVRKFSIKKQIRYFLRELDESTDALEIEFMKSCGFHRFNRNFCFEYTINSEDLKSNYVLNVLCRRANKSDISKLLEIDMESQILEYRDALFKNKRFIKGRLEDIFVFVDANDPDRIYGFACKRNPEHHSSFELVLPSKQSVDIDQLFKSFAETYLYFEKNALDFRFIIKEDQIFDLQNLSHKYRLTWSTQLMILEGNPRMKDYGLQLNLQYRQALN